MPTNRTTYRRLSAEALEDRRMLAVYTVDTHLDVVNASDGVTSLREAIASANAAADFDQIQFAPSLAGETILLNPGAPSSPNLGPLEVTQDLEIVGLGADQLTINGNGRSGVFVMFDGGGNATLNNVAISGLTITGGNSRATGLGSGASGGSGGGIYTEVNLTLTDSVVTGNIANVDRDDNSELGGGGIAAFTTFFTPNSTYTTTILRCVISNNRVVGKPSDSPGDGPPGAHGGGIKAHGTLIVTDSTITGNTAGPGGESEEDRGGDGGGGGGIYSKGTATITRSTISNNRAGDGDTLIFPNDYDAGDGGRGGGILAIGSLTVIESVIANNHAGDAGQSIYGTPAVGGEGAG